MSKRLIEVLARAGSVALHNLAGRDAVGLLERIDSHTLTSTGLATIVVDRFGASQVLSDKHMREIALSALRTNEAAALCGIVGVNAQDPYDALLAIDFGRSESLLETLHSFFGVTLDDADEAEETWSSKTVTGPYTLFAHQRRASREVRKKLAGDRARVLLHMPTGAGKTRTALTTICDLLREQDDETVIVWLAHSEELCDQAVEEAAKAWSRLGSRELTIYRHYGSHRIPDGILRRMTRTPLLHYSGPLGGVDEPQSQSI